MPEPTPELRLLVDNAVLDDVVFSELSARRNEDFQGASIQVRPAYRLHLRPRLDSQPGFQIALEVVIRSEIGVISATAVAAYTVSDAGVEVLQDQTTVIEFGNEVAVMTLIPYLRYAIADITTRVFGAPLLMPVLHRGDIRFDPTTAPAAPEPT